MNSPNPDCLKICDNLLSEYPHTIKKEHENKIYKEYKSYYSLGIIKKAIELYHIKNQNNNEYSAEIVRNLQNGH